MVSRCEGVWLCMDSIVCYILNNLTDTVKYHKISKVGLILSKKEVLGKLLSSGFSPHHWKLVIVDEVISRVIVLGLRRQCNFGVAAE